MSGEKCDFTNNAAGGYNLVSKNKNIGASSSCFIPKDYIVNNPAFRIQRVDIKEQHRNKGFGYELTAATLKGLQEYILNSSDEMVRQAFITVENAIGRKSKLYEILGFEYVFDDCDAMVFKSDQ